MNLIYQALLCGLIATIFVHKSEATLPAESIVGGNISPVTQQTYAVSIQNNNYHLCGGGILNNWYIITAAHCFIDLETNKFDDGDYIVVAGVTHAHNKDELHRVMREVAKIYIPRDFNPAVGNNADIAVLQLTTYLGLNQFITKVVLPPNARSYPTYANRQAIVCGYGHSWVTIHRDAHTIEHVEICTGSDCYERKFAVVNIMSNMECRHVLANIMASQICGSVMQRSPDTPEGLCGGDSGAPLVIGNTIIGVMSESPRKCREDLEPATYTRVTSFMRFIINAMNGVRLANMRLAKYKVGRYHTKILVEQ